MYIYKLKSDPPAFYTVKRGARRKVQGAHVSVKYRVLTYKSSTGCSCISQAQGAHVNLSSTGCSRKYKVQSAYVNLSSTVYSQPFVKYRVLT